jgi:hypothetical protein
MQNQYLQLNTVEMQKENIIKEFMATELSLPLSYMQDNADLYTLSMLSEYFKYTDSSVVVAKSDIDTAKLKLSPSEFPYEADKKCFRFNLLPLMLDGIEYPINSKTYYYEESFSRDGFTEYTLALINLMIRLEETFVNCNIPDNEAELCNTVEDLVKVALKTAVIPV